VHQVVRGHTDDVLVGGGVADLTQAQPVGDDRLPALLRVRDDVGAVQ
jgi:hypothetical protein